jgi:predicted exporter
VKSGRGGIVGGAGAIACWLWLALCCVFLAWKFSGDLPIDTDIQSMLPESGGDRIERAAMDLASQAAAGRIAFLVEAPTAELAGEAADDLTARLRADGLFVSDMDDAAVTGRWIYENRNQLLCELDPAAFNRAAGERTAKRALADVFSVTGAVTGDLLAADPFLLTIRLSECLPPVVPAGSKDGQRLVSGRIAASAYRMDAQARIVAAFADWKAAWAPRSASAARAGAVFHAEAAAERAKAEMSLIGVIGTIGVVLLFFAAFRTVRSVVQGMALVGIGLAAGLAATLVVFPGVHVLVFVFAAMLVGIVSDYAVHTLATGPATDWADSAARLRLVGRPVTVSMATTVLGFGSLALFGVPLFQQVALLSGVGIVTAWAFVLWVLVPMDRRPGNAAALRTWWLKLERWRAGFRLPAALVWSSAALLLAASIYGATQIRFLDDVRQFQPRPADLVAEEERVRAAGYGGSGVTFLLSEGATPDEAREREEAALAGAPVGLRVLATSRFDPSAGRRAANEAALTANLYQPLLQEQESALGLEPASAPLAAPDGSEPPRWLVELSGAVDGRTFLVAPVLDAAGWTGPATEGSRLVDPAERYSAAFASYREHALIALAVAFFFAVVVTMAVYRRIAALSLLAPPLLAVAVALAIPPALGFPLTFFSFAAALVLLGVGIDYAAFQWEGGAQADDSTAVAVGIDAATTLLSMGLLAASATYPVRSFGLTVAIGIAAALCLSHIPRLAAQSGARRP